MRQDGTFRQNDGETPPASSTLRRNSKTPVEQQRSQTMKEALVTRLSVLKRDILKTLAFAFGLRLRSKTRRSKKCVLGNRVKEVVIWGLAW